MTLENIPTGLEKQPERSSFVAYIAHDREKDGTGLRDPATLHVAAINRTDGYGKNAGVARQLSHAEVFTAAAFILPGVSVTISHYEGLPDELKRENIETIRERQGQMPVSQLNRFGAVTVHGATKEEFEAAVQTIVDRVDGSDELATVHLS